MAAAITTSATTLEGQLFEVANALQAGELAQPEASRPNRVSITCDTENAAIAVTVTLDATMTATGQTLSFVPIAYLP